MLAAGKRAEYRSRTEAITPGWEKALKVVWSSTVRTLKATSDASAVGSDLNVVGTRVGGLSCTTNIDARDSQTAVKCRCEAIQTNSSNGPAGRVINVTSDGSAVIALNRSLSA